jgi:hypothetical protein
MTGPENSTHRRSEVQPQCKTAGILIAAG